MGVPGFAGGGTGVWGSAGAAAPCCPGPFAAAAVPEGPGIMLEAA